MWNAKYIKNRINHGFDHGKCCQALARMMTQINKDYKTNERKWMMNYNNDNISTYSSQIHEYLVTQTRLNGLF